MCVFTSVCEQIHYRSINLAFYYWKTDYEKGPKHEREELLIRGEAKQEIVHIHLQEKMEKC